MVQEAAGEPGARSAPSEAGGLPITITLATAIAALVLLATATVLALQWHTGRTNTFELANEISPALQRVPMRLPGAPPTPDEDDAT